jgi:hypothetical protein
MDELGTGSEGSGGFLRLGAVGVAMIAFLVASVLGVLYATVAQAQETGSLTTTFESNNSGRGNTFDLEVLPPQGVVITSFNVHLNAPAGEERQLDVWTRPETSVGFEEDPTGWTNRGRLTVASGGLGNPTPLPLSFSLSQGSYGFAISLTGTQCCVRYTNGPPTTFEDAALRLTSGSGVAQGPIFGGGTLFAERIWNGTIHYVVLEGPPPPDPPPPNDPPPADPPTPPDLGDQVTIRERFAARRRATLVRRLIVRGLPDGAAVRVQCKGRGCTFRGRGNKRNREFQDLRRVNIGRLLRGRKLRRGARIILRVTEPDSVGVYVRYRIRRGKRPRKVTLCLPVGSSRPQQECS